MNVWNDYVIKSLQLGKEGCHKQHRVRNDRSLFLLMQEQASNEMRWGRLKVKALVFSCHIIKQSSLPQNIMGAKFKS